MRPRDFAPDDPLLGSHTLLLDELLRLGPIDVGCPLTQVEFGILLREAPFDSQ